MKAVEDTQDGWLMLRRGGMPADLIADEAGVSPIRVKHGLAAARAREPSPATRSTSPRKPSLSLTLAFGSSCKPLALLTCADVHPRGPMPEGTRCCCASCHKSGVEGHPDLVVDRMPAREKRAGPTSDRKRRRASLARSAR